MSAVAVLVVGGNIAFLYFAESARRPRKIREDMNPFNVSGWLVKMVLASPGIAAFWLSRRIKPKQGRHLRRR